MKRLFLFIVSGILLFSTVVKAEVIKFNCGRTDYRDAKDDILLIDLSRNIMKINDLPDYRITKISEDIITADSNSEGTLRSLEFKRYTGKLHFLILDLQKNKSFIDWHYQCKVARKII
jgi:hypothetical protein